MKQISILFDSIKFILFSVAIFMAIAKQEAFVSLLLVAMVIISILMLIIYWMAIDNDKKTLRALVAGLEFSLLFLGLVYFQINGIFNSVLFFWIAPLILRWYLPNMFYLFSNKKRNT